MSDKVQCCYCGRELNSKGKDLHELRCPLNPEMAERIKGFVFDYCAKHGGITSDEYRKSKERKALEIPDSVPLFKTFGSWENFIKWCGVKYKRTYKKKQKIEEQVVFARIDAMLAQGRIDYESAFDYRAMPACRRYTERYIDLDTGQVHERIVTVLR